MNFRTLPNPQFDNRREFDHDRHSPNNSKPNTTRLPNSAYRLREYLTEKEVDRLIEAARKRGRNGPRDAAAILLAYRHGLRASELC